VCETGNIKFGGFRNREDKT
jgi:hypothetical protein